MCLIPEEIRVAVKEPLNAIIEVVKELIAETPPELIKDIKKDGILMAGGGALLRGLDKLISRETTIRCRLTKDPLTTVVMGSGMVLENIKNYRKVFIN